MYDTETMQRSQFWSIKICLLKSEFFLAVLHSLMKLERSPCAHLGQSSQDGGKRLDFLVGSVEGASDWNLLVL